MQYSAVSEAPDHMRFWTGIATLAGAVQRHVWIDQVHFKWIPNFYIILVGPPGVVAKSTTYEVGLSLLREVPDINFGPNALTWQALIKCLADSRAVVTDKSTGEELAMSCVMLASSELGTLLDPDDRQMIDAFVDLWDCRKEWWKSTISQGDLHVEHPHVNMIACTTPRWIGASMPEYMIGGGFTSRCIFCYADQKAQYIAYPKEHAKQTDLALRPQLINDLTHIAKLFGECTLTREAIEWGTEWYEAHYRNGPPQHLNGDQWGGYYSRKQGHIHKLAIILSIAESDNLQITDKHLQLANDHVTSLEQDMIHVYSFIGRSPAARSADAVMNLVLQHKVIDREVIFQQLFRKYSAQEIEMALRGVTSSGLVKEVTHKGRQLLIEASYFKTLNQQNKQSTPPTQSTQSTPPDAINAINVA